MAEAHSTSRSATPSTVPAKRALDTSHAPSISSPLNPTAPAREQREKKDSLKKREASGTNAQQNSRAIPDQPPPNKKFKGYVVTENVPESPVRYNHSLPRDSFHYTTKHLNWGHHEPEPFFAPDGTPLQKPLDHTENKKNFRYTSAVADPTFPHIHYYRTSDSNPPMPRLSFTDSDKWFHFSPSGRMATNEKGWRMGRANVCAREGTFYYEVKILKGVPAEGPAIPEAYDLVLDGPLPHVRVGFARREAPLDAPVGFDGYSYGLTDIRLEPIHKSRPSKFLDNGSDVPTKKNKSRNKTAKVSAPMDTSFAVDDHARSGDIIGLQITLPSLSLHRKIADGSYNPAVDTMTTPNFDTDVTEPNYIPDPTESAQNILRDRFPVPYKGGMFFESHEFKSTRSMEAYGDRGPFTKEIPNSNHNEPSLRCLPGSHIKIYKNGKMIGTAFKNLMAFLPPCSTLSVETEGRGRHAAAGANSGLATGGPGAGGLKEKGDMMDDGAVGYYPAIGLFSGAVAEINLGPNFAYPPEGLTIASKSTEDADIQMIDKDTTQPDSKIEGDENLVGNDVVISETQETKGKIKGHPTNKTKANNTSLKFIRPISERYAEQIAEDIIFDVVDEIDFFVQDGGKVEIDHT